MTSAFPSLIRRLPPVAVFAVWALASCNSSGPTAPRTSSPASAAVAADSLGGLAVNADTNADTAVAGVLGAAADTAPEPASPED
jgi:hypothetical protein